MARMGEEAAKGKGGTQGWMGVEVGASLRGWAGKPDLSLAPQ